MSGAVQVLADSHVTLKMICLQVHDITCFLEQRYVVTLQEFSGNHESKTICIETSLGLPVPEVRSVQTRSVLQLKTPLGYYRLEVNQPALLMDVSYADIQPLPSLIATSIYFPYVRAMAMIDDALGLILDMSQLEVKADLLLSNFQND